MLARMANLLEHFPEVSATYFFDNRGDLLYTSDPQAKSANVADRPFFQEARDEPIPKPVFSEMKPAGQKMDSRPASRRGRVDASPMAPLG